MLALPSGSMRLRELKIRTKYFRRFSGSTRASRPGRRVLRRCVDDVALGINADFVLHAADAADLRDMPDFAERLVIAFGRRLDLQLLEAVFATVLARV